MRAPWLHSALTGLIVGQVTATTTRAASSTPVSSPSSLPPRLAVECYTRLATTSVAVIPTSTVTRTYHDRNTAVVYVTTQDVITVTPPARTETETSTETLTVISTAPASTDTFSTTSTDYEWVTNTATMPPVTVTTYTTTTVTTATQISVPTAAGFVPLASSLQMPTAVKRDLNDGSCSLEPDDYRYASAVKCIAKLTVTPTSTSTVTAVPITNTVLVPVVTVTVISTLTTTSVVVPGDISVTLSYSTTLTLATSTTAPAITSTATATRTVTTTTTTGAIYAACATNNVAGGQNVFGPEFGSAAGKSASVLSLSNVPSRRISVASAVSGYDCCVKCQQATNCAISFYHQLACYIVSTDTCSSSNHGQVIASSGNGYDISNGPCGTWMPGPGF